MYRTLPLLVSCRTDTSGVGGQQNGHVVSTTLNHKNSIVFLSISLLVCVCVCVCVHACHHRCDICHHLVYIRCDDIVA